MLRVLQTASRARIVPTLPKTLAPQRNIFQMWQGWMRAVWNRVDSKRLELVGRDRWHRQYNALPWLADTNRGAKPRSTARLTGLDATGSEVNDAGLQHIENMESLELAVFRDCSYLSNSASQSLATLRGCRVLDLTNVAINEARLVQLCENLPSLERLYLAPHQGKTARHHVVIHQLCSSLARLHSRRTE
ncbi:uncharacterized protein MONBRDRAFT_28654 [Monosiga brevicollis MX1]|uniref:Mitochondrial ATP synthase regulatory component factor B n=1 Tax=Monosiga brevicollis TaxID=81824 RepID=A9V8T0_MONBE|nr:uncharacterized protein MONBRDRAFT_28654 [Monosiga brevicollis MX1]EDQ85926.1 predicted protein [Monosiga brevicollis MX1]|eukprot:XP_001749120.1 hypothetical protein [Monosiga brevicollis MX1]